MDPSVRGAIAALEAEFAEAEAEARRTGVPIDRNLAALEAGPEPAGFLNLLIRAMRAKTVVEVGTSYGYTALWLGEAARDTGGRVITMEAVEVKHLRACKAIEAAGLSETVESRLGDAGAILRDIEGPIDLAFIDAWNPDYPVYFDLLLPKMRVGGCLVADDIANPPNLRAASRAYQAHVRANPTVLSQELAIGDGLEMTVKLG